MLKVHICLRSRPLLTVLPIIIACAGLFILLATLAHSATHGMLTVCIEEPPACNIDWQLHRRK